MSMAPKAETIAKFARKDGDTGSPEVQIALLTARIVHLTEHLKRNRKDYSTQTGLLALVNRRKKLLAYLARENYERYVSLCGELNIRRKQLPYGKAKPPEYFSGGFFYIIPT